MSGISSYFDGETGIVTRVEWERGDPLYFYMYLDDNPNRENAMDYDSDIRIDATVQPGDHVIYKKLDNYCGFWFKQGETRSLEEILRIREEIREEQNR